MKKTIDLVKNTRVTYLLIYYLRDRRGYGMAEMMIIVAIAASVSAAVLTCLLPSLQGMHTAASDNIRSFGGSGF